MTTARTPPQVLDGAPPAARAQRAPGPAAPLSVPSRPRRRPSVIAVGVALAATGAVLAAWLFTTVSDTEPVVAVAEPVARGEVVTAEALTVANIVVDPVLAAVPAGELEAIVGQRAVVDLAAGGIVTADAVAPEVTPGEGEAIVGVAVTRAQLPVEDLVPGDRVRVVGTPRLGDDPPGGPPPTWDATVHTLVQVEETGEFVVDVVVPTPVAPEVAAQVATGRVAVVLDARTAG